MVSSYRDVQRIGGKQIGVQGLDAFRRELLKVQREGGPRGYDLLKKHNYEVAEFVRRKAVSRANAVGRQQARAAASLVSRRSGSRAELIGGNDRRKPKRGGLGASMPFFGGAEFGADHDVPRQVSTRRAKSGTVLGWNQFLTWKEPGQRQTGYFLFPTMRDYSDEIKEMYAQGLDRIMREVFPD
jgi:hypothetical protein